MTTCKRCGKTNPADIHTCTPPDPREEIIRMAREAGFYNQSADHWDCTTEGIERFAALVVAAERDRLREAAECFRMCEHGGVCYAKTKGNEAD